MQNTASNSVTISAQNGCSSTKPHFSHTMLCSCPLLDIETQDASIEDVCSLSMDKLSQEITADPCYVFQVLECCHKLEACLQGWYGPQILSRIMTKPVLVYNGGVHTNRIIIDFDRCMMDFEGFGIQCGSQMMAF